MTTASTNLGLTLYSSGSTDQSGSFITWTQDMSGSVNSNMTKIDGFAGSASGSITRFSGSASASATAISGSITNISGSISTLLTSVTNLGLRWAKLDEFTGAGTADFNNISGSYTHLLLIGVAAGNKSATNIDLGLDFNGDANSSNYTTLQWGNWYPSTEYFTLYTVGGIIVGNIPASGVQSNYGAPFFVIIPNYSSSTGFYKSAMGISAFSMVSPAAGQISTAIQGGTWLSANPITRIRVFGTASTSYRYSFWTGTKISLYGIG